MDSSICVCKYLFVVLCVWIVSLSEIKADKETDILFDKANYLKNEFPDSAINPLLKCKQQYLEQGDTLKAIQAMISLSQLYANKANYVQSYDGYWDALIMADEINNNVYSGQIYDGLALLYSLFKRYQFAEEYYKKALLLKKRLLEEGRIDERSLNNTYYLLAIYHRELNQIDKAKAYLDSCEAALYPGPEERNKKTSIYIEAEKAYLDYYDGNYTVALKKLHELEPVFDQKLKGYLVILNSFMAKAYDKIGDKSKSESYYLKSIAIGEKYKSHQNYMPDLFESLSELYQKSGKLDLAYQTLKRSKYLNDSIFGARSQNNKLMLEIKDDFRVEQQKKQQIIKSSKLSALEQDKRILFLRSVVLSVSIASILIIFFVVYYLIKSKHKNEKKILNEQQEIKEQKNKEIIEIKNKELTESALQLIEKDELLLEIKKNISKLKTKDKSGDLGKIIQQINSNSKRDWNEFNARFTSINEGFYKSLHEKFPSLTQKDHKLCALIKLNFSSKDMAQLLGISIESVHTSRYRLRQKLKLGRSENLTEFIARIE